MSDLCNRTHDELLGACGHLAYEIRMFNETARILMSGAFGEGVIRNALLESFTVHTRQLLQFFHPSGAKQSDVLAEHYFDDPMVWRKIRGGIPSPVSAVNQRVGREIAHLTYGRLEVQPDAKAWNIRDIREAMMQLVEAFLRHAPTSRWVGELRTEFLPSNRGNVEVLVAATTTAATHVTMVNTPAANTFVRGWIPTEE
jgi:hypothetical protein